MTVASDPTDGPFYFGANLQQTAARLDEVGNKGFNLMKMARAGLPVPPGFVLGTSFCAEYLRKHKMPSGLDELIRSGVGQIERATGLGFGGSRKPMLLSVRSGAAVSMPGMMETILDLGLCDSTVASLVRMTGNPHFVWDSYRRLIQTFAEVVHGASAREFDGLTMEYASKDDVDNVRELDTEQLRKLSNEFLEIYQHEVGYPFPQEPREQLDSAVEAVFRSWESIRAIEYRSIHHIEGLSGTAVVIQLMVFGNMGGTSGSGVAFTRDPATGENRPYIDFLFNAQGEDVVSGKHRVRSSEKLSQTLPGVYKEIQMVRARLESEFKDMQDFEFTVQEGKLYLLQCRRGNRTPLAALQIAVDLVNEGVMDKTAALKSLQAYDLSKIERTVVAPQSASSLLSRGIPASIGVATGEVTIHPQRPGSNENLGKILVRHDISTEDIGTLAQCSGILTSSGGRTSHAAVVARQMNKVCVVGCRNLSVDLDSNTFAFDGKRIREGEVISLDGNTGNIYAGEVKIVVERPNKLLEVVEGWKARQVVLK